MRGSRAFSRFLISVAPLLLILLAAGCEPKQESSEAAGKPTFAFITNGPASFWEVAEKGAAAAGKEYQADIDVFMPTDGAAGQKQKIEDLLIRGIDGIAITPIDPEGQLSLLNDAASQTLLITHDSDAPKSDRICYVGINNYDAGWMCGELVKEALPDGGKIALFIGRIDQLNSRLRRQGVIDAILGREKDQTRYDENGGELTDGKYTIVNTYVDGFDETKCKSDASDCISRHADLKCMVGLFAYNPPLCLTAIKDADKLDQIEVVAFDENDGTLQGIVDEEIYGTVVQNPYMYGYESIRILSQLKQGKDISEIIKQTEGIPVPEESMILFPARIVKKSPDPENESEVEVQQFWDRLKELTK